MRNTITFRLLVTLLFVFAAAAFLPLHGTAFAAESNAPGGTVQTNDKEAFTRALGESATVEKDEVSQTLTVTLNQDIVLTEPLLITMGDAGDKVIIDLNGHSITGAAGQSGTDVNAAAGQNALEIAADEFDVEINGPGSVIGGKGARFSESGYRYGTNGGCAVFFSKRVDKLHGITSEFGDITDEGYRPDKLEHGLKITGGAALVGGSGSDVTYNDWVSNIREADMFSVASGNGGPGIGQVITGIEATDSLEELSYARIDISDGSVTGGAGGNVDTADHLFTTTAVQKIDAVQEFMEDRPDSYDFTSNVMDHISFVPGDGGNGIEFFAGRKYIAVESDGQVYGGNGGKVLCSERAAMVKNIETECGEGGKGIYVCGDTGLTNAGPSLSDTSTDAAYWGSKTEDSDDVGIYVAGLVKGGSSPATTLLNDSSGNGGVGIDCELNGSNYLCEPYPGATFNADRGIVLVDKTGSVLGGDSASPDEVTMRGGNGGDAIMGGSTGSPASNTPRMTAGHFVIKGIVAGGYGSSAGGDGASLYKEREYLLDSGNSAYFVGYLCGDGTIKGGDSGVWPTVGNNSAYSADASGIIYVDGTPHCADGIYEKYTTHPGSLTISNTIREETGAPARVMEDDSSFKVSAEMTAFKEQPDATTKLRCSVTPPKGYDGKIYITWKTEIDISNPRSIYSIEGADGAYNDFTLLGNKDYPYGIIDESHGKVYKIDVGTYDRMADRVYYNNTIHVWCYAILEDGRIAESNEIWFSKTDRSPTGWINGGSEDPIDADQAAADRVQEMIDNLPLLADITLADADAVATARAAYEALTDAQKQLLAPYVYLLDDLEKAEAKIATLKREQAADQAAADQAVQTITDKLAALPEDYSGLDPENPDDAAVIAAAKAAIEDAVAAYNDLTDAQKRLVEADVKAQLDQAVETYNDNFPDDPAPEPVAPEKIVLTADMITVAGATYTGKALTPTVTVKHGGRTLVRDADYTLAYANNTKAGKGTVTVTGAGEYAGTVTREFTISKAANPLTVKAAAKAAKVKYKKLRKKNQNVARSKVITIKKAGQGTMKYSLTSAKKGKKSFKKYFKINAKTGKVTVKKKLKKGTYQVTVKVTAAGNSNFKSAAKKVTFKVKVR